LDKGETELDGLEGTMSIYRRPYPAGEVKEKDWNTSLLPHPPSLKSSFVYLSKENGKETKTKGGDRRGW
jgi:hypothetical protein